MGELAKLQSKIENLEADAKLHARLMQRTNQPQSYVLNDLANQEKKIDYAERKIKSLEDQLRKTKHENDQLKLAKKSMADDLSKISNRRSEIDNLHQVLIGIINHSTAKKIDVEDLRVKLAESMRRGRQGDHGVLGGSAAEVTLKKR